MSDDAIAAVIINGSPHEPTDSGLTLNGVPLAYDNPPPSDAELIDSAIGHLNDDGWPFEAAAVQRLLDTVRGVGTLPPKL